MIAQRKTIRGIEGRPSDEKARVARHREERAMAEATRNSEDRVPTGAAVAGTDNAAEAREPATTAAKLSEARRRAKHLARQ